jgi:putative oxidoreductase
VQRLFSTFPNSWPGLGLLILRLATGISLAAVAHTGGNLVGVAGSPILCVLYGVALLLWIGLWTPLAAIAGAAIHMIVIIFGYRFDLSLLVFAGAALSLAMLGPGAWSFDARLFGRKRII